MLALELYLLSLVFPPLVIAVSVASFLLFVLILVISPTCRWLFAGLLWLIFFVVCPLEALVILAAVLLCTMSFALLGV